MISIPGEIQGIIREKSGPLQSLHVKTLALPCRLQLEDAMPARALVSAIIIAFSVTAALHSRTPADAGPRLQSAVQLHAAILPETPIVDYTFVFTNDETAEERSTSMCGAAPTDSSCW
jgi:hypothetical protein